MAKGLSSAHAVIGAVAVTDKVYAPFAAAGESFLHGNTFGGHLVMAAVALKNIEIMERLDIPGHVRAHEAQLEAVLCVAPPLVAGIEEFEIIGAALRTALSGLEETYRSF